MITVEHKLPDSKHTALNDMHTGFMPEVRTTLMSSSQNLIPSQLNIRKTKGKVLLHQTSDLLCI